MSLGMPACHSGIVEADARVRLTRDAFLDTVGSTDT